LLRTIQRRKGLSGDQLLKEFRTRRRIIGVDLPADMDDSHDDATLHYLLTQAKRIEFGIPYESKKLRWVAFMPRAVDAQPVYQVRINALLCANDNGTGGALRPNAVTAGFLAETIDRLNENYHDTDIVFDFDPDTDFETINDSLLNLDFTVPSGLDYTLPEDQPPLSDEEIKQLKEPHLRRRREVAARYRNRLVLMLSDGNMLQYVDGDGWVQVWRTYAFSGGNLNFVAMPTGHGFLNDEPNYQGWADLLGHEIGHYFHLGHTHGALPETIEVAATLIKNWVTRNGGSIADGATVFDGDRATIGDTAPDPGPDIFALAHSWACAANGTVEVPVDFGEPDGTRTYPLTPDRTNGLSYFFRCPSQMTFSSEQVSLMGKSITCGNREHLVNTAVCSAMLGALGTNLLQNPNAELGSRHWIGRGDVSVTNFKSRSCFVLRNRSFFHQDVAIPSASSGSYVVFIGRLSSERINADGSITGLPYLYGYLMQGGRILSYLQGQNMLCSAQQADEWVVASGVFPIPANTDRIRFFMMQAERADDPQNGSEARFDHVGLYVTQSEAAAQHVVERYTLAYIGSSQVTVGIVEGVTHEWKGAQLGEEQSERLTFFAAMQTFAGDNAAAVRLNVSSGQEPSIKIEEETSKDQEIWHIAERVGYIRLSEGLFLDQNGNGIGEIGTLERDQKADACCWRQIFLEGTYSHPIVLAQVMTSRGTQPVHTRIRNVLSSSFEIRMEEWDYEDGDHTVERIAYVIIERGVHTLADGAVLEAGLVEINHDWHEVTFQHAFASAPVVLSHCQTYDGHQAVVTRQRDIGARGFHARLQEEEANDGIHVIEVIGCLAVEV
jgi:hypothetical protein